MILLDQIEEHVRTLEPRRALQGAVAFPFVAVGWAVGTVVRGLWWAGAWAWSATVVGFQLGRAKRRSP